MNRRVCVWIGSVLGCAVIWRSAGFGTDSLALGQNPLPLAAGAPAGPGPAALTASATAAVSTAGLPALQTAPTITPGQSKATIAPFIAKQLAALAAPDVMGSVSIARQALMLACPRTGVVAGAATPAYQNAYAAELATATLGVLSAPVTPVPVKINIGIVVERVASNGQSQALLPIVQRLLADRADPVVYWGCKAARPMVLAIVLQAGFNGKTPLFRAIVNAVAQHGTGNLAGLIATEAYKALVINPTNVPNVPFGQMKPLLKYVYDPVLDLLELRTAMYAQGVVPAPDAEANVPTFLTTTVPPPIYTDAQKARAVQDLVNLIDFAGQRASAVTNTASLRQMLLTIQNSASALDVFSQTQLVNKVVQMPLGTTGPTAAAQTVTVYPLMTGPFPYLKKPMTLPPVAPPTDAAAPAAAGAPAPPGTKTR